MDIQSILKNGVDLTYKPILQVAMPEGVDVVNWLAPGLALVRGTKFKDVDKRGVFSYRRGLLAPPIYQAGSLTDSGLILLRDKKSVLLLTKEGVILAGTDCDDAKDLGEGLYAKKQKKLWAIFRVSDQAQLTDYLYQELSAFSEGSCAAGAKDGTRLLGVDGKPLFAAAFEVAHPFKNGYARVGSKKELQYVDRSGRVLFSGAGRGSRDFCNGFAVIADKHGKLGAIDGRGQVVIPPQYRFMKDAGSDMFVVSNTGAYLADGATFRGSNFGLIRADGSQVLPMKYGRLDMRPDGKYTYGHVAAWQIRNGNYVTNYGVQVSGVVDETGRILMPDKYVSVGELSEGLRAFKTFENDVMRMGYMDEAGNTVIDLGKIFYKNYPDPGRQLLREELSLQLRPFCNGTADVCVKTLDQTFGTLFKNNVTGLAKVGWYRIDRTGAVVPEASGRGGRQVDVLDSPSVPFRDAYNALTVFQKEIVKGMVYPFDELTEVNYGDSGFAILDRDLNCLCASYTPPALLAQFHYHDKYKSLTKLADNVWQAVTEKGESVTLFSEFESPTRFSSGLAPFRVKQDKHFLWGFMDAAGRQVVPPCYDEVKGFTNGYALGKTGKQWNILYREAVVTPRG